MNNLHLYRLIKSSQMYAEDTQGAGDSDDSDDPRSRLLKRKKAKSKSRWPLYAALAAAGAGGAYLGRDKLKNLAWQYFPGMADYASNKYNQFKNYMAQMNRANEANQANDVDENSPQGKPGENMPAGSFKYYVPQTPFKPSGFAYNEKGEPVTFVEKDQLEKKDAPPVVKKDDLPSKPQVPVAKASPNPEKPPLTPRQQLAKEEYQKAKKALDTRVEKLKKWVAENPDKAVEKGFAIQPYFPSLYGIGTRKGKIQFLPDEQYEAIAKKQLTWPTMSKNTQHDATEAEYLILKNLIKQDPKAAMDLGLMQSEPSVLGSILPSALTPLPDRSIRYIAAQRAGVPYDKNFDKYQYTPDDMYDKTGMKPQYQNSIAYDEKRKELKKRNWLSWAPFGTKNENEIIYGDYGRAKRKKIFDYLERKKMYEATKNLREEAASKDTVDVQGPKKKVDVGYDLDSYDPKYED